MSKIKHEEDLDRMNTVTDDDLSGTEVMPQRKGPREYYTIRGELCVPCLRLMLSDLSVACLRDSDQSKCRCCVKNGRRCKKVPNQFDDEVRKLFWKTPKAQRSLHANVLLSKTLHLFDQQRKAQTPALAHKTPNQEPRA
ncbi:hypothetical protein POX_b02288 [Penicillium oxalicum]|uniref:Uncharacterized protein n=1 Tax=Penicillium oxalicum (strain 114-2 / CGMCC 5302) TaxID=933388 RepID=S8AWN5_PENO1|nr:hypothetical protein POX_b02288 [Penicillium oxalicum]EPS30708.1 hypothetical protein PDE_05660 [Penicillium oxalicum 114-2]KAI2792251.1 hypothetical protein POX_b02288 [Penicillium oxalicum]